MQITLVIDSQNKNEIQKAIRCLEGLLRDEIFRKGAPPTKPFETRQWRVTKWRNKISAVRIIREYSDYGLKEAKSLADWAEKEWVEFGNSGQFFEDIRLVSDGFQIRDLPDSKNGGDFPPPDWHGPSDPFMAV